MADYFAILKRAVGALPEGSREQRQAIYDKARKALLAQLQQMDPPLAPSEISKQRVSLEEAIRSIELELSRANDAGTQEEQSVSSSNAPAQNTGSSASSVAASEHKPPVGVAPAVELGKDNKAKEVASQSAGDKAAGQSAPQNDVSSDTEEMASRSQKEADAVSSSSDKVVRRAGQDVLKNAVRDANALGSATSAAVKSAQETADIVGDKRETETARIEPTLGDAVVSDVKTYKRAPESQPSSVHKEIAASEKTGKQSQTGLMMAVLLLAGGLGISAYLLYQNKDAFLGEEASPVAGSEDNTASNMQDADKPEEMPAKTVRTVVVTPDGVTTVEPAGEESGSDTDQTSSETLQETDQADVRPENGGGQEQTAEQTPEVAQPALPVAQRSIFYEEESAGSTSGRATPGQAIWSIDGKGDEATVKVEVAVPDRNVGFSISLKKNLDPELPASHLIEVVSSHNNPDEPRVIDSIPGLILKPTEQSRGVGLAGAAIRIADDMYWIALKSEAQAVKYNMELLVLRSWIDMPLLYKSGRRAILTLEKGEKGDAVIKQALVEWGLLRQTQ